MKNKSVPSVETQNEAAQIAKATQKPGQTKEQTKLIAQGIEKGIALYKKQQKEKSRQADKAKKRAQKQKQIEQAIDSNAPTQQDIDPQHASQRSRFLPWTLLAISWVGFIAYLLINKA